eukprot:TRINITY_DN11620_c0_g1_i1.p1 TRINITY_DN11620_c0_g1~~TRINITY_DN11620_c0_g1_i1.p1  ORF type:complete len:150 (+),score=27.60 TRINITY_DN11620_c0_g1_i1:39-452(+)
MSFDPRAYVSEKEGLREVTWAEMAEHSKEENAWLAVYDRVYDVSKFMNDHPGGADPLWQLAGEDATREWDAVGHGPSAAEKMEKMLVGRLVGEKPGKRKQTAEKKESIVPMEQGQSFAFTMALVVGFTAVLAYYLFR